MNAKRKKSGLSSLNRLKQQIVEAGLLIEKNQIVEAFAILNYCKAEKIPIRNMDFFRAQCFLKLNQTTAAYQASLEELRNFPDHVDAESIVSRFKPQPMIGDSEFRELYKKIQPYTMVGEQRLFTLFSNAKQICENNLPGNFLECGVAAGGSSALLSYVVKKYSKIPRQHYAFDSFEGMPEPKEEDVHKGVTAHEMGWGTGTCSAPEDSVKEIASKLGCSDIIVTVKGYFNETLPIYKNDIGNIALLHMDGDWYDSTWDILVNLYDQVNDYGYVQVDDYGFWEGCSKAIHEWETQNSIRFDIEKIDETGVFFLKPKSAITSPKPLINFKGFYLNLGCGSRFHQEWNNFDFSLNSPDVKVHDLSQGIPVGDGVADVVYHSHILEHFSKRKAKEFIQECFRVLKPGGILRVVVPDLEQVALSYINNLKLAKGGNTVAQERYEWTMIELLDQTVRAKPGGEMLQYWKQQPMPAQDFVVERMGDEVLNVIQKNQQQPVSQRPQNDKEPSVEEIIHFRNQGEIHQWMYDEYSLSKLLCECGFTMVRKCIAAESEIPEFNSYCLDIGENGKIRKPDSLFMEAKNADYNGFGGGH